MLNQWFVIAGYLLSLYVRSGVSSTVQDMNQDCDPDPGAPVGYGSPGVVMRRLRHAKIVPDVLDDIELRYFLHIIWRETNVAAYLGNELSPSQLQSSPGVWLSLPASRTPPYNQYDPQSPLELRDSTRNPGSSGIIFPSNFVVALTDPDAPSRENPEWSQVCHWLFSVYCKDVALYTNFGSRFLPLSESAQKEEEEESGCDIVDLMPYKPPGPPKGTGRHRYTFVVLMPANNTDTRLNLTVPGERRHWGYGEKERAGVREWATDHELVPIAANFVYAQSDE